jgi:protein-tyrosine phosphatase
MYTELHWMDGPWPGKLAISARPRGGDWLDEELASWRKSGVGEVVSLLTPDEVESLELQNEAAHSWDAGMQFRSFPIVDRSVPASKWDALRLIEDLDRDLTAGKSVSIHCRQGVGRAGLIAASLLVARGLQPAGAFERISLARGVSVPETAEQRAWVDAFASELAGFGHPLLKDTVKE